MIVSRAVSLLTFFRRQWRLLKLLIPLGFLIIRLCSLAAGEYQLRSVTDEKTGIKIGIPPLLTEESATKWGRAWSSRDKNITLDTFTASAGKTLRSVYESLRRIEGRVITKNEWSESAFLLEGRDPDGGHFHIEARQKGAAVRGYAVVYSEKFKADPASLITAIAGSFDPFGAGPEQFKGAPGAQSTLPMTQPVPATPSLPIFEKPVLEIHTKSTGKPHVSVVPNLGEVDEDATAIFSPDRRLLAVWSPEQGITLWDIASARPLRTIRYFAFFTKIIFSPDGKLIISSHKDGSVNLWDVEKGENTATFKVGELTVGLEPKEGQQGSVWIVDNGKTIVTTSGAAQANLWDTGDLQQFGTLTGQDLDLIEEAHLSADAKRLITVSGSRGLRILDIATGRTTASVTLPEKYSFHSWWPDRWSIVDDATFIVTFQDTDCSIDTVGYFRLEGGKQGKIESLDRPPGCERPEGDYTFGDPQAFRIAGGKVLIARQGVAGFKLWNAATGMVESTASWPSGRDSRVIGASPDGDMVVTNESGSIRIRSLATGQIIHDLRTRGFAANHVIGSPSRESLALYSAQPDDAKTNLDVRVWELGKLAPANTRISIEGKYNSDNYSLYDLSDDGKSALRSKAGEIVINSTESGREIKRFSVPGVSNISDARLSPDGSLVLIAGSDNEKADQGRETERVLLVSMGDGKTLLKDEPSEAEINPSTLGFSADGTKAVIAYWNGTASIWDTRTGKLIKRTEYVEDIESALFSFAISDDGKLLVGGHRDTGVSMWDVATGKLLRNFKVDAVSGHVNTACVAISHDKKLIAGGMAERARSSGDIGAERGIKVWNAETGKLLFSLEGHEGGVKAVAFSQDDRYIVSASYDGTVRYWERATGKWLATTAFARDGQWLTITESGFFAASSETPELVNVVRGLESFSVTQFRDHLYRPDLVEQLLKGDPEGKYTDAASKLNLEKILDSGSAPQVAQPPERKTELIGDAAKITVRLTDTGGGIGEKVVWRVNGVTQGEVQGATSPCTTTSSCRIATQTLRLDPTKKNVIEVTAYNGVGLLATEPYRIEIDKFGVTTEERPHMYVVTVGVSDYAKSEWHLKYAAKDAQTVGDTLKSVARGLYGEPQVVPVLDKNATAKGIEAAIDGLRGEMKSADVFVLYVAGHGRSIAGTYYFLPQDLQFEGGQTIMSGGISQDMLQKWLAKIPAQKSILILDTCESAAARGADIEQETAIDRLQHATGRSVITAASSSAFEGYQGHGLLTYTILDGLTKPEGGGHEEVTLSKLAAYVYDQVPKISQRVFGERQQPHNTIADDFPLGERVAAANTTPSAIGQVDIPKTPTHVLIRTERVREQPSGTEGERTLAVGTLVRVVQPSQGWALVAREGEKLGYVSEDALAPIQ